MKFRTSVLAVIVLGCFSSAASAETPTERGAYLVTTIGACGNCHSPRDAEGKVVADKMLAGGNELDVPGLGHIIIPNITPDRETGIGKWTDAQIVTALRNGKRPDGTIIGPPMPIPEYRQISDGDATAIAAYLKSLKPVHNAVARTQYKMPLPPDYGPPVTHVDAPSPTDKVAYGRYLAWPVGHCVACHTPPGDGVPFDMSRPFAGGRELPAGPEKTIVSTNITPDPEAGIGKWSDDQIKLAITTGVRPNGTPLSRAPMPFDWYANIAPADLDAIVAYLRSLKPMK
jgi:mono/diheme cytochrome c family protein